MRNASALTKHAIDKSHIFDFNNVDIVDKENDYQQRLLLEMLHIKRNNNPINSRNYIQNVSLIYNSCFNIHLLTLILVSYKYPCLFLLQVCHSYLFWVVFWKIYHFSLNTAIIPGTIPKYHRT